jgi:hypothetical protein
MSSSAVGQNEAVSPNHRHPKAKNRTRTSKGKVLTNSFMNSVPVLVSFINRLELTDGNTEEDNTSRLHWLRSSQLWRGSVSSTNGLLALKKKETPRCDL